VKIIDCPSDETDDLPNIIERLSKLHSRISGRSWIDPPTATDDLPDIIE
jgi:hypothetical protein